MSFGSAIKGLIGGGGSKEKKPKKEKTPKPESSLMLGDTAAQTSAKIIDKILLGKDPYQVHNEPGAPATSAAANPSASFSPSNFFSSGSGGSTPFGLPQDVLVPLSIAVGLLLILVVVDR